MSREIGAQVASGLGWRFIGVAAGTHAKALMQIGGATIVSRYNGDDFVNLVRPVQEV